jgi:fermentation-respiration switch protein FrsA (DUF1100 family)
MENHFQLGMAPAGSSSLADIVAPTLVVHGDEDPVFALGHGLALAEEIPGARLMVIPRLGHEMPPGSGTSWSARSRGTRTRPNQRDRRVRALRAELDARGLTPLTCSCRARS